MKANPGGQLAPQDIVGRDSLISSYWGILTNQGIYLNDLRRIGKTQIMVKMHSSPPPGWVTIMRDVSGYSTAAEFATRLFADSHEKLGGAKKTFRNMEKLAGKLSEIQIAGALSLKGTSTVAPWKDVLDRTFADIDEQMQATGSRIVFFLDEIPFLLSNIAKKEGADTAMEVLDTLRALAQQHDRIRLFLTGSIGLHHVLESLHGKGYNGSPLNRMSHEQPGPLEEAEASRLAVSLLIGEGLKSTDPHELGLHIARETGCVPFYIQRLVSRLPRGQSVTPAIVTTKLLEELTSSTSGWDLEHYNHRLTHYYGNSEKTVRTVLNLVAVQQPVLFSDILKVVQLKSGAVETEELTSLMERLCKDHYLHKSPDGYSFYLEIIRRWWVIFHNL